MTERLLGRRYVLHERLGAGPVGETWLGTSRDTGDPVIAKVIAPVLAEEPQVVTLLLGARRDLLAVRDAHLVAVLDVVAENRTVAVVTEFHDGETLLTRIRRDGPMPPATAALITAQVLGAVAKLHRVGLSHGTIRPGSVLLVGDDEPHAILGDFALSVLSPVAAFSPKRRLVSSPEYLAPGEGGEAGDVYAASVLLSQMLTGEITRPSDAAELEPWFPPITPPSLRRLGSNGLSLDPSSRPSPESYAAGLRQILPELDGVPAFDPVVTLDGGDLTEDPPGRPKRPAAPTISIGDELGSRYVMGGFIGRGATGEVWWAEDRVEGDRVAVKVLHPEMLEDPTSLRRFVRERFLLMEIQGDNIVGVRDFIIDGETVAIVMDLIEGGDLRSYIDLTGGPLPRSEALGIAAQVLRGLQVVHDAGVVHRDVKPANVLLRRSGSRRVALLTDFGISGLVGGSSSASGTALIGTPRYMAPELTEPGGAVAASDQYSTGVMLYEMLTGRLPFVAEHPMALLRAHLERDPERPEGLADADWELIRRLLAKKPTQRFADADDAAAHIEHLLEAPSAPEAGDGAPGVPAPPPRRRMWVAATALAGLVLAGVGGAAWWAHDDEPVRTTRFTGARDEPEAIAHGEFVARAGKLRDTIDHTRADLPGLDSCTTSESTDRASQTFDVMRFELFIVGAVERLPLAEGDEKGSREVWEALHDYSLDSLSEAQRQHEYFLSGSLNCERDEKNPGYDLARDAARQAERSRALVADSLGES